MADSVVKLVVSNKPKLPEPPKPIRFLCRIGWHQKTYPAEWIGWKCGRCPAAQTWRRGQGPGFCD